MIHLKKFRWAINRAQKEAHLQKEGADAKKVDRLDGIIAGLEKAYKLAEILNKDT